MVITDHINVFPEHPLHGKNINELGPRFPAMVDAYSPRLIQMARDIAKEKSIIAVPLHTFVCELPKGDKSLGNHYLQ